MMMTRGFTNYTFSLTVIKADRKNMPSPRRDIRNQHNILIGRPEGEATSDA
jgi:hypothetical protein